MNKIDLVNLANLDNPVTAFCSQSRALFDGGLFDKRQRRFLPRWITTEFAVCREASFHQSSALSKYVDHSARTE